MSFQVSKYTCQSRPTTIPIDSFSFFFFFNLGTIYLHYTIVAMADESQLLFEVWWLSCLAYEIGL